MSEANRQIICALIAELDRERHEYEGGPDGLCTKVLTRHVSPTMSNTFVCFQAQERSIHRTSAVVLAELDA